jgi:hypothetical protein
LIGGRAATFRGQERSKKGGFPGFLAENAAEAAVVVAL